MKKTYIAPEVEIEVFSESDILQTSGIQSGIFKSYKSTGELEEISFSDFN